MFQLLGLITLPLRLVGLFDGGDRYPGGHNRADHISDLTGTEIAVGPEGPGCYG